MSIPGGQLLRDKFPHIPLKALHFFHFTKAGESPMRPVCKNIFDFSLTLAIPKNEGGEEIPQVWFLKIILDKLCNLGYLRYAGGINTLGPLGYGDSYICELPNEFLQDLAERSEYQIYGFEAVYNDFKSAVFPLVHINAKEDQSIGSCFLRNHYIILTARHCIENAQTLSIKGITSKDFYKSRIVFSKNEHLDLAALIFPEPVLIDTRPIDLGVGNILDEVLVMGYPNVPGFTSLMATERAMISSRGTIASEATEMFAKTDLFLITARIKGGFSGGPVINNQGLLVGLISREPIAEGKYEDLGYGVAIPTEEISRFLNGAKEKNPDVIEEIKPSQFKYEEFK